MSRNTGRFIEINVGRYEDVQTIPYPVFLGGKKMIENKFRWYTLPEEVRNKLMQLSGGFYTLKDQGMWIYPPDGYEQEVIIVLRTHGALSYDVSIPTIINMMRDGILTAIFPVGMKVMDVVFYQFDKDIPFHCNAYLRAGLEGSMKMLK